MLVDTTSFEDKLALLPQPVALAVGRVVRARYLAEQLDAIVEAAEVLVRYVAVAALASFAARDDAQIFLPDLQIMGKNLAFGDFLRVAQTTSGVAAAHPLAERLNQAFKGTRKNPDGLANTALISLLNFRNRDGHDLRHLDEGKARAALQALRPDERLAEALRALSPVLNLPLVVVEQQEISGDRINARFLLLMGETEPTPRWHEVVSAVHDLRSPYLVHRDGLISLGAGLIWDFLDRRDAFGLFICDKIKNDGVDFKSIADDTVVAGGPPLRTAMSDWLSGVPRSLEPFALVDQRTLIDVWREHTDRITAWRRLERLPSPDVDPPQSVKAVEIAGGATHPEPTPTASSPSTESGEPALRPSPRLPHASVRPTLEREFLEFHLIDAPRRVADVAAISGVRKPMCDTRSTIRPFKPSQSQSPRGRVRGGHRRL